MKILQNLEDYWMRVHELAKTLPPVVYITSVEVPQYPHHRAGVVVEHVPFYAAQDILDGTHRLSTEEEVAQYKAGMEAARERAKQQVIDAKGIHIHNVVAGSDLKVEAKKGK
ncbi:MAG TPA: hypothetical protein VN736_01170 [Candidatus Limnocylindrales bacterium]|nr:hypothetical protein [Candidatus Limnocylindrales bacterium]